MKKKESTLQNQLEEYIEYFNSIEVVGDVIVTKITYPTKWIVYGSQDGSIKAVKSDTEADVWFYYGKKDIVRVDDIFNLIGDTIKENKAAEAKIKLLNDKFAQLKEIFAKESLEKLQTLDFIFSKKKGKKQVDTPVEPSEVSNDEGSDKITHTLTNNADD